MVGLAPRCGNTGNTIKLPQQNKCPWLRHSQNSAEQGPRGLGVRQFGLEMAIAMAEYLGP